MFDPSVGGANESETPCTSVRALHRSEAIEALLETEACFLLWEGDGPTEKFVRARKEPSQVIDPRRLRISRRDLLRSIMSMTGGCTAALSWDSSGWAASRLAAQDGEAGDVAAETVQYRSGETNVAAFLAKPKTGGEHPGVILVHDDLGLVERFDLLARRLAAEGFVVMAPDLLSRAGGTGKMTREEALRAIGQLQSDGTVDDLNAAYAFLAKDVDVDSAKISAVGFGWGAWRIFMMAEQIPTLYRAVAFYGTTPDKGLDSIHTPILGQYAQLDFRITGNAVYTQKMLGKNFTYYVYPNVRHTFFYEGVPGYDAEAASLAWKKTVEFLKSSS
jgi:carboxymethylenebutenolidase